jgi:hypothetical protein
VQQFSKNELIITKNHRSNDPEICSLGRHGILIMPRKEVYLDPFVLAGSRVLEEELLVFISNTGTGPVPSCFDHFPLEDNEDSPFWILKRFSPTKASSRVAASNCSGEKVAKKCPFATFPKYRYLSMCANNLTTRFVSEL